MTGLTQGQLLLRKEIVSATVTGFALKEYKLKPLCMIASTSAWQNTYLKEGSSELTGGTGAAVKGIPRGAAFPYGEPNWTEATSYQDKYGMEGVVTVEDEISSNIPVISRELLRISRAVTNAVDIQIESVIAANAGNTTTISVGNEWNNTSEANRNPIHDILDAKRLIDEDNYDPDAGNGYLIVNPYDYEHLLENTKVVNNPTFKAADVVANGVVGEICGLKIVKTSSCTTSQAYVVIAKEALTWVALKPLTSVTIDDPGIKKTIRAWEYGVCQTPNVNAMCKIVRTRA